MTNIINTLIALLIYKYMIVGKKVRKKSNGKHNRKKIRVSGKPAGRL